MSDQSTEDPSPEGNGRFSAGMGTIKSGMVGIGTLLFVVVFFPVLVLGSGAVLVFLTWPLFLGAFLEYGYLPGSGLSGNEPVSTMWYLVTFVWLLVLTVGPYLSKQYGGFRFLSTAA
ncbi:hypothetical protein AArcSl_0845 [Halalkaliarchaeum desulfuricum]|uniref:Uncharacterized protein n=1 Tax=Halalkaliarchaeum desulfuricum TaxID=2055893 RepID=A0A343THB6_9EURY|nr:hypothetical protein [Halalkaliarchaeum desulfuricum]AUX08488.1 hypothetical protein AArcSl_0845 [Halalkaliarchaeum desulfuricum]